MGQSSQRNNGHSKNLPATRCPLRPITPSPEPITLLTIADATGGNYRIEATSDLVNTNVWTTLTNLTLPSSPFEFVDKTTPQPLRRFYRAIPVP